ncbi:MAG: phosphotransferase enzyme family protein [Phycisphaerales bacterium JB037]
MPEDPVTPPASDAGRRNEPARGAVESLHAIASIAPGQGGGSDAHISEHELRQALTAFGLTRDTRVRPLRRGDPGSPKFIVEWSDRKFLLKRRSRERSDPVLVALCHEVMIEARSLGAPLPKLLGTNPGDNSMLQLGGHVYELMEFVEGAPFARSAAQARSAGRALADLHRLLARCSPSYGAPVGSYHASAEILRLLEQAGERATGEADRQLAEDCRRAYERAAARAERPPGPAAQLIHGDWHPGNLLFADDQVAWVLDLDGLSIAPPETDVAMGALQFALDVVRGPGWSLSLDLDRLRAFLEGAGPRADRRVLAALMVESLIAEVIGPIARTGRFGDRSAGEALREVGGIVKGLDEWADGL